MRSLLDNQVQHSPSAYLAWLLENSQPPAFDNYTHSFLCFPYPLPEQSEAAATAPTTANGEHPNPTSAKGLKAGVENAASMPEPSSAKIMPVGDLASTQESEVYVSTESSTVQLEAAAGGMIADEALCPILDVEQAQINLDSVSPSAEPPTIPLFSNFVPPPSTLTQQEGTHADANIVEEEGLTQRSTSSAPPPDHLSAGVMLQRLISSPGVTPRLLLTTAVVTEDDIGGEAGRRDAEQAGEEEHAGDAEPTTPTWSDDGHVLQPVHTGRSMGMDALRGASAAGAGNAFAGYRGPPDWESNPLGSPSSDRKISLTSAYSDRRLPKVCCNGRVGASLSTELWRCGEQHFLLLHAPRTIFHLVFAP